MISIDYGSAEDIDRWTGLVRGGGSGFPGIAVRAFYKQIGFTKGKLAEEFGSPVQEFVWNAVGPGTENVNCPCKKTKCERHGNCDACRAYHAESKRKRPCERTKNSRT